ncbi:hypothetical protein [Sutcliffiella horikoshii]|uniref:hypothetical protein n=1 Tax=Sutcliffiella horikoshii TaxID=79883 RepID=UPI0011E91E9D
MSEQGENITVKLIHNLVNERIKNKVLAKLLFEKGIITEDEFNEKFSAFEVEDRNKFVAEILNITEEQFKEYNK